MIKRKALGKVVHMLLILALLLSGCGNTGDKDAEEYSLTLIKSKIENTDYDFNIKLDNFYTEEQVKEVKKNTEAIVEQALKYWDDIEKVTGTLNFDYSNIQPNLDAANYYYEKKVYPSALSHYFAAQNYALRVITYYKLEKGLLTEDELYDSIKMKLNSYKSKYNELKDKSLEYQKYISKEELLKLIAAQYLISVKLDSLSNRLKNLDYYINNKQLVHIIGSSPVNYNENIIFIEDILDSINTTEESNIIDKISKDLENKVKELEKRLEVLLNTIDEEKEGYPEHYLTKDSECLMSLLEEDIEEGYIPLGYYSIYRIEPRIELVEQIINGEDLTLEELFDRLVLSHETLFKKIKSFDKKIDIRWLNGRFTVTSADIFNLIAEIASTNNQDTNLRMSKILEFKRRLYVNIADILWLERFIDSYQKL